MLLNCAGMLRVAPTNQEDLGVFSAIENSITTDIIDRATTSIPYVSALGDLLSLLAYLLEQLLRGCLWGEIDIVIPDDAFPGVATARGSFWVGYSRAVKGLADRG